MTRIELFKPEDFRWIDSRQSAFCENCKHVWKQPLKDIETIIAKGKYK